MTEMPSAINRVKTNNLLVKVDKENENKDIKRKQKTTGGREKSVTIGPTETVWNRLSRVRKVPSNEAGLELPSTSRTALTKSNQRSSNPTNARLPASKKPLSPTSHSNRATSAGAVGAAAAGDRPKRILKAPKVPYYTNPVEVELVGAGKMVTEILTARSICDSKSSSGSSKNSGKNNSPHSNPGSSRPDYEYVEITDSKESLGDYRVAPLIPVPTNDSMDHSSIISKNFCSMLQGKKRTMAPEEIDIIKEVIKTDGRYRHLEHNSSKLFKDILKTQLHEILRQGTVVKTALTNLDATSEDTSLTAALPMDPLESPVTPGTDPQVDVIFKNVPTLEKEIIILKALGEKLEATLKRTNYHEPRTSTYVQKLPLPSSMAYFYCWSIKLGNVEGYAKCLGVSKQIGVVREFQIVQKSIVELKECCTDHFYLPTHNNSAELKCTTFKRLKRNPEVLMRHLKPKNALVPFNVLEQDPLFFNSFIQPPVRMEPSKTSLWSKHDSTSSLVASALGREAGDFSYKLPLSLGYRQQTGCFQAARCRWRAVIYHSVCPLAERYKVQVPRSIGFKFEKGQVKDLTPGSKKPKQNRRNKRKQVKSQANAEKSVAPRHSLALTIIVGGLQVSVFLLLIMAFTYPDIKC